MDFEKTRKNQYLILGIRGRIDIVSAPELESELQTLLDAGDAKLVLDMQAVEYISSAGLRSILVAAKKAKAIGGEIRFCGLKGMVSEVFTLSGFNKLFVIRDSAEAAAAEE